MRFVRLTYLWLLAPLAALCLLGWTAARRAERVAQVGQLAIWNSTTTTSATPRALIVPEHNEKSYDWLAQTEQLLAAGDLRVRQVDYDNPPAGREVRSPSPYRWWLGGVATADRALSARPLTAAVERAAVWADPLLLGLFVLIGALYVARRFGPTPAILVSLALVTWYPLAAAFVPGAPDDRGLGALLAGASVLVLLAAWRAPQRSAGAFALAGIVGGLALWVAPTVATPVLASLVVAGLVARLARWQTAEDCTHWRPWALTGAVTVLAAWLFENAPDRLADWRLSSVHPLHGLAWLGAGELLAGRYSRKLRDGLRLVAGLAALAALGLVAWRVTDNGFLSRDLLWARLTSLPAGVVAADLRSWLRSDGFGLPALAVLSPLAVVGAAGWLLLRRATSASERTTLLLALGPVLVAAGFAWSQLYWWTAFGVLAAVLLVAVTATGASAVRWLAPLLALAPAVLGFAAAFPHRSAAPALTASEAQELIERHLARWLEDRSGTSALTIYAPPRVSTGLSYYGRFRGIGSFAPENRAGFATSLAVAGAKSFEEIDALLRGRGVRYLVMPSWDPFFDNFAELYLSRDFSHRTSLLAAELRRWNLPPWLRPVPYQLPVGGAFEGQSVRVFEIVDDQRPAVALARLGEYLVEMGEPKPAAAIAEALRRFPGDVGALAARVQVLASLGATTEAAQTLATLKTRLASGADRYLPWDRRVSLALTLAQADQVEPAIAQVKRCLAEIDDAKLRSLTTGSLYNFLLLTRAIELSLPEPHRTTALGLLPVDLRHRL